MFKAIKDILHEPSRTQGTTYTHEPSYGHTHHHHVGTTAGTTTAATGLPTKELGVVVEKREVPPVVREHIYPTEKVEIIPIIHREREQLEVRELTQKIIEKGTLPTDVREEVLPEERREGRPIPMDVVEEKLRRAKEQFVPTTQREAPVRTVEEKPPIVTEEVRKKIIEELVPVVERYLTEPHLIYEKKHIYEKVFEEPVFIHQELPTIERSAQVETAGGYKYPSSSYGYSGTSYTPQYQRGGAPFVKESTTTTPYDKLFQDTTRASQTQYGQQRGGEPGMVQVKIEPVSSQQTSSLPAGQVRYT